MRTQRLSLLVVGIFSGILYQLWQLYCDYQIHDLIFFWLNIVIPGDIDREIDFHFITDIDNWAIIFQLFSDMSYAFFLEYFYVFWINFFDTTMLVIEEPKLVTFSASSILTLWVQLISIAILTIWARGVGPRFRPDQLSDLTWKDLLLYLSGLLGISLALLQ